MKTYKCAECEKEKQKSYFPKGELDEDPLWWTCKACAKAQLAWEMSAEFQQEIARQMEKDD